MQEERSEDEEEGNNSWLPVHLKYDLFAIDGDIPTCFYHSFPFVILWDKIMNS